MKHYPEIPNWLILTPILVSVLGAVTIAVGGLTSSQAIFTGAIVIGGLLVALRALVRYRKNCEEFKREHGTDFHFRD